MFTPRRLAILLFLAVLPLGCGRSYKVAPVSGRITMDGHPMPHVEVRFTPTDGPDLPYSVDTTDDQGKYVLHLGVDSDTAGAVVGEHRVTLSQDQRRKDTMPPLARLAVSGARRMRPGEVLPGKYNRDSKLLCTVPGEGNADVNFDLKSK
jgi:hypothetical protein